MNLKLTDIRSEGNVRQDLGDLKDLAASIEIQGVLEPLVVKKNGKGYILIAGHRRLAAAKMAKLTEVPVHVVDLKPEDIEGAQLAENLHRRDLTPFEVSQSIGRELTKRGFRLDHEQAIPVGLDEAAEDIARKTGTKIGWVKSMARLVYLPEWASALLKSDNLTIGQAMLLLSLPPQSQAKVANDFYPFKKLSRPGEKVLSSELEAFVEKAFGKDLKKAPFSLEEPIAGKLPCVMCQWNTACTPDLFKTETKADAGICRQPDCFKSKCQAVSTEAKEAHVKKTGLPFVGYASRPLGYGYGTGAVRNQVPEEVRGFKVVDKMTAVEKKLLDKDIDACLALDDKKKPVGKAGAKTFGFAVLRANEGFKPEVIYVRLKGAKEPEKRQSGGHQRDIMRELVEAAQREMRHELVVVPGAERARKAKVDPVSAAIYLTTVAVDTETFQLMGYGETKGRSHHLKGLTWEQLGRAALFAAFLDGNEQAEKVIGLDPEKLLKAVEKPVMSLAEQVKSLWTPAPYSYGLPPGLVEAVVKVVKGEPFAWTPPAPKAETETPEQGEEEGDDGSEG